MQFRLKATAVIITTALTIAYAFIHNLVLPDLSVDTILLLIFIAGLCALALWFFAVDIFVGERLSDFLSQLRVPRTGVATRAKHFSERELKEIDRVFQELLRAREQEISVLADAEVLDSVRYRFVQVMSHRLRTPVTGLSWVLDEVQRSVRSGDTGKLQSDISRAKESLSRIQVLIEELIRSGNLEKSNGLSRHDSLQVSKIINDALLEARELAESKKVKLSVHFPEKELPTIQGNQFELISVLQNIISNAIHYSLSNGTVTVAVTEKGKGVEITVADNGIGIPSKEKSVLFQPFVRGHNSFTQNTEGIGLGLHLSKEIIKQHGGAITFESQENVGSTFHIYIPTTHQAELERYIAG